MNLHISWFLGFGWISVLILVGCAVGINLLSGPVVWLLYIPFLVVAIYMTVRFRLYTMHPWRRVHSKAMISFARFAATEYDEAKKAGREYDVTVPCQELARVMFSADNGNASHLLTDVGRKDYYRALVKEFPQIFLKGIAAEQQDIVFEKIQRDIDASKLGPDILVARDIELRYSRKEAAVYLQSLMLGAVR